jgi:CDP-glucose 4,6-dehydratase
MSLYKPEIIFHLAAQPIVKAAYDNPRDTYEINVIGTLNILEVVRKTNYVKSFVNITTDKVYLNKEWVWAYRENEELNGFDPYSNSKSCSELITSSYIKSFFGVRKLSVSTARSGNVIGGGDFSANRIIPDCIRALKDNKKVILRNPNSTRPYLHVLDTLFAYLLIAKEQYFDFKKADSYNIGPSNFSVISTKELVDLFSKEFTNLNWELSSDSGSFHEANLLSLDTSKIIKQIGWFPRLTINEAIKYTAVWVRSFLNNPEKIPEIMKLQINNFIEFYSSK